MNRRDRLRRAALVLGLLVLAASVSGVAASATTTVVPKQLTGRWTSINDGPLMVVGRRGKVNFSKTGVGKDGWNHARFSHVTAHNLFGRLSISGMLPSCSETGTYRWTIFFSISQSGPHLNFKKIHDACKQRVDVFLSNTWRR